MWLLLSLAVTRDAARCFDREVLSQLPHLNPVAEDLPHAVLEHIFSFLAGIDRRAVRRTCTQWKEVLDGSVEVGRSLSRDTLR